MKDAINEKRGFLDIALEVIIIYVLYPIDSLMQIREHRKNKSRKWLIFAVFGAMGIMGFLALILAPFTTPLLEKGSVRIVGILFYMLGLMFQIAATSK